MISFWRNPLPSADHGDDQVVVYFFNGSWVPIMFYSLREAIELYRTAKLAGQELFIFPLDLTPDNFSPIEEISFTSSLPSCFDSDSSNPVTQQLRVV